MSTETSSYSFTPFHKGQTIFKEGQQANTAYLVKSGTVTIKKKIENKQVTLAHIKAGHIFGEMGIISGEPRNATALAEDYCELVVIDNKVLNKSLLESSKIIQAITKTLIQRLQSTSQKITSQPAGNLFISACNIIEIMYSSYCQKGSVGDALGIPYNEVCERLKNILSLSQLEISTFVKRLQGINAVQIVENNTDARNVVGQVDKKVAGKDRQQFLKLTDPKTFLKMTTRFYEELKDTFPASETDQEFIDIHDFAAMVNSTPEMIYKKIGAGEIPENIFFINKRGAAEWSHEVGITFFQKVKRRTLNIEELSDVNDVMYVDNTTLQDAFSKLGPYKVCILVSIAGDEARSKIMRNLSTKIAAVVNDQIGSGQTVDEVEAGDIEREFILTIKSLKGVSS